MPFTSLAVGAGGDCTSTYVTTQVDVDRGAIANTGTAVGTTPSGRPVTAISSVTVPADQNPAIALTKTANLSDFATPGTIVTYSYKVTNSGNVTLDPAGVTDPMPGLSPISCPFTLLAPGIEQTCTATYTTTQGDVDRGAITNTGTASGRSPAGPVMASDTVTVPAIATPRITVVKSATPLTFTAPGTVITYDYLVTNAGNVTLTAVDVTDPMQNLSTVTCPDATLAPGAEEHCTATYTTTQADLDRGSVDNTGTATGTPPAGSVATDSSTATVPAIQTAAIGLVKSAGVMTVDAAGTVIIYSYLVTNRGNVTLSQVEVTDQRSGVSAVSCPDATLLPGIAETCTATYTTTQADIDIGTISNTATASADNPGGMTITSAPSTATVEVTQNPALTLVKTASLGDFEQPGQTVTYSYTITNTGNVTLSGLTVTDPMAGLSEIDCMGVTTLAPNASVTCTATYVTTQADVERGQITNTGTARAVGPEGQVQDEQSTDVVPEAGITLVKSASISTFSAPGAKVTYSYKVTNTGNVSLTAVTVTDPMAGLSAVTCPDPTLAPAVSETCTATYTTTQADVDRGAITNTGTASGAPPQGANLTASSSVTIPATQAPGLSLVKSANVAAFSTAGTKVTYSYLVINTGNVTVTGVRVVDPMQGLSAVNCPTTSLAPTASVICTATYTTTAADLQRGSIVNAAFAAGSAPAGVVVVTRASTVIIPDDAATPVASPAAPESPVTPETIPVTG